MKGRTELNGRGEVLFCRVQAERGLSARRSTQYLGDNSAAALHGSRRPGRVGQDVDQPVGGKIERLADGQSLAERLPIDQQRKIDGKLHHRARTDRSDMLDAAA